MDTVEIDCCAEIYLGTICVMCVSLDLGSVGLDLETVQIDCCAEIHPSPDLYLVPGPVNSNVIVGHRMKRASRCNIWLTSAWIMGDMGQIWTFVGIGYNST